MIIRNPLGFVTASTAGKLVKNSLPKTINVCKNKNLVMWMFVKIKMFFNFIISERNYRKNSLAAMERTLNPTLRTFGVFYDLQNEIAGTAENADGAFKQDRGVRKTFGCASSACPVRAEGKPPPSHPRRNSPLSALRVTGTGDSSWLIVWTTPWVFPQGTQTYGVWRAWQHFINITKRIYTQ